MLIDALLKTVIESDASDLILKVGSQPAVKVSGRVLFLSEAVLTAEDLDAVLTHTAGSDVRSRLDQAGEVDYAFSHPTLGRFRTNAFRQSGVTSIVMRQIKRVVPGFAELALPERPFNAFVALERGLVLITGVTGSGKSTTVAAIIDTINNTRNRHIITLEDPIEYKFTDNLCIINQREVGQDTRSWLTGLRAAMREAPDVIVIGEIRDQDTMAAAIAAAETGHLVVSTLHTTNAVQTVERIMTFYPPHQHPLVRFQLSTVLAGVASQRLLSCLQTARMLPAVEVMMPTPRTRELLRDGKTADLEKALVEGAEYWGSQTFNMSLKQHLDAGRVTVEEALAASDNPDELKLALRGVTSGSDRKLAIVR